MATSVWIRSWCITATPTGAGFELALPPKRKLTHGLHGFHGSRMRAAKLYHPHREAAPAAAARSERRRRIGHRSRRREADAAGSADPAGAGGLRWVALFTGIDDPVAADRLRARAVILAPPSPSTPTCSAGRIAVLACIEDPVAARRLRACAVHLTDALIRTGRRTGRIAVLAIPVYGSVPAERIAGKDRTAGDTLEVPAQHFTRRARMHITVLRLTVRVT